MEALHPPKGLIVDLITPLTSGYEIDNRGLERHLKRVLPYIQALFLASPSIGEGKMLGLEQREELLDNVLSVVKGRIPIFTWLTQKTQEETKKILLRLRKRLDVRRYIGQIFWVDAPLFYHSNRGLPLYYQDISSLVPDPFILYNAPGLIKQLGSPLKRNNIRTNILKELVRINKIQGLIFSGSLDRAHNYQKAVRTRSHFRIYDGDESRFLVHPSLSGVVSMGANLVPKAWNKITSSSLKMNGSTPDYPDYLKQIWEIGGYLDKLKDIYNTDGPILIKMILADKGIIESPVCLEETENLEDKFSALKDILQQYDAYD